MLITAAEVASLLHVSEETVFAWARRGGLPFSRVQDQYRFNRSDVLEWATAHGHAVSPRLFAPAGRAAAAATSLAHALAVGGIHRGLAGRDRETLFAALTARLPLPPEVDRELVTAFLLASEALGPTALGEGIAIPHVHHPMLLRVREPFVALCFAAEPVALGAPDGVPVSVLLPIVAPTTRVHLELLARIAAALHDADFRAALATRAPDEVIVAAAAAVDEAAPRSVHAHAGAQDRS